MHKDRKSAIRRRCTRRAAVPLALALASACAGCSGDGTSTILAIPPPDPATAAASSAPPPEPTKTEASTAEAATAVLQKLITPSDIVVGTPTEVYTRIARGALTCWFGAAGPLKPAYIYHADAAPASRGGVSEIKILTRDSDADDPRALRAYRVLISPSQDKTRVEVENVRIAEPLAKRLSEDVDRWSRDEEGCGETPVTAGWSAEQVVETKPTAKAAKKKAENAKKP